MFHIDLIIVVFRMKNIFTKIYGLIDYSYRGKGSK